MQQLNELKQKVQQLAKEKGHDSKEVSKLLNKKVRNKARHLCDKADPPCDKDAMRFR